MKDIVLQAFAESTRVKERFVIENADVLVAAAGRLATCFSADHRLFLFGNGGSAADAQHMAAEFVNRFAIERKPLSAIALSTDTSILTSIANDYSFEQVFSKQIKALGRKDDVAMGISTSGSSGNVVAAMKTARDMGLYTIGLTGCGGGELADCSDIAIIVDSQATPRIQEAHVTAAHVLCELVERILFPESFGET